MSLHEFNFFLHVCVQLLAVRKLSADKPYIEASDVLEAAKLQNLDPIVAILRGIVCNFVHYFNQYPSLFQLL